MRKLGKQNKNMRSMTLNLNLLTISYIHKSNGKAYLKVFMFHGLKSVMRE